MDLTRWRQIAAFCGFLCVASMLVGVQIAGQAHAQTQTSIKKGRESGLPIPRYVSLKSNKVNVRKGPALNQSIVWVFRRTGLPVEIMAEYGPWRKIRDSDGSVGWVYGRLLSGRRTALVAPWVDTASDPKNSTPVSGRKPISVYAKGSQTSQVVAFVEPRVIANIANCSGQWCKVSLNLGAGGLSVRGWIKQKLLWGVYPQERLK